MSRAPFKYLDSYRFEDADLYFGREEIVQSVLGEILSSRLLVLFSPSGSGKTSLINAGLCPALDRLGFQTVRVRLKGDPVVSVKEAFEEVLRVAEAEPLQPPEDRDLHAFLASATRALDKPVTVFLDQFEEFFIFYRDQPELRKKFVEQIAKVRYDEQLPVLLVFSLREDYYANLHEFRKAIPSIFQSNTNLRLEPFTDEQARRAIKQPLLTVGAQVDDRLVDHIVADLRNGEFGVEPIRLQIVCHVLWQSKKNGGFTAGDYEESGKAAKILQDHTARLLERFPWWQRRLLIRICQLLTTPEGTKCYRTFAELKQLLRIQWERRLKGVLARLERSNLVRHEIRHRQGWYELKHDYLVKEIAGWVQKKEEGLNRKLKGFAVFIAVVLLLGAGWAFYEYHSYYARFVSPSSFNQVEEIQIERGLLRARAPVATGLTFGHLRDQAAINDVRQGLRLGFRKRGDWTPLLDRISAVWRGYCLFDSGEEQAGVEAWLTALQDTNLYLRWNAAYALGISGTSSDAALVALIAALKDPVEGVRSSAAEALGRLGRSNEAIVNALLEAARNEPIGAAYSEYSQSRQNSIYALSRLARDNDWVYQTLVELTKDSNYEIQGSALRALVSIGRGDDQVAHVMLRPDRKFVGQDLEEELEKLAPGDSSLLAQLSHRLETAKNMADCDAAVFLGRLAPGNDFVVGKLLKAVSIGSCPQQAVRALGILGRNNNKVTDALVGILPTHSDDAAEAAQALGRLGRNDDRIIDALIQTLTYYPGQAAAEALGKLGRADERVIDALVATFERVRSIEPPNATLGARRPGQPGPSGSQGKMDRSVLSVDLTNPLALGLPAPSFNQPLYSSIVQAISRLGRGRERIMAGLVEDLKRFAPLWQSVALDQLADQGDAKLAEAFLRGLKDSDAAVRFRAAALLGRSGASGAGATDALVQSLQDLDPRVRAAAAEALGKSGQRNDNVLKALIQAFNDTDSLVLTTAQAALGVYWDDKPAGEMLSLLQHPQSGYRLAAAVVLARQKEFPGSVLQKIDALRRSDPRPWVRFSAGRAYSTIQLRLRAERFAGPLLATADAAFREGQLRKARQLYSTAFDELLTIARVDAEKAAYAKLQEARCAVRLGRLGGAFESLDNTVERYPQIRKELLSRLDPSEDDWKHLADDPRLLRLLKSQR